MHSLLAPEIRVHLVEIRRRTRLRRNSRVRRGDGRQRLRHVVQRCRSIYFFFLTKEGNERL